MKWDWFTDGTESQNSLLVEVEIENLSFDFTESLMCKYEENTRELLLHYR